MYSSKNRIYLVVFALVILIVFALLSSSSSSSNSSSPSTESSTTAIHRDETITHKTSSSIDNKNDDTPSITTASLSQDSFTSCQIPNFTVDDYWSPNQNQQQQKVLSFNPLYPWFGLTNQMLSYAAATRYAIDENRAILFPDHHQHQENEENVLIDFHQLFNAPLFFDILRVTISRVSSVDADLKRRVTKHLKLAWREDFTLSPKEEKKGKNTYFYTPLKFPTESMMMMRNTTVFVQSDAFPFTSMNKKNLFLPNRDLYRVSSKSFDKMTRLKTELYMRNLNRKASAFQFTRHHNFFMRYPWVLSSTSSFVLQEAHFLNALQPHDVIEQYWMALATALVKEVNTMTAQEETTTRTLKFVKENFVALHLRVERDASLLSKKLPSTAEELMRWMKLKLIPKLLASTTTKSDDRLLPIYLCLGEWPSETFEQEFLNLVLELEKQQQQIKIYWRGRIISTNQHPLPHLPKSVGIQRESQQKSSKSTQDHFLSFVDFLFLTRSKSAIVSQYSSLKFPVFAKRCYFVGEDVKTQREVKSALSCVLTAKQQQRMFLADDDDEDSKFVFEYNVDEQTGKFSELSVASCKDKSNLGWAGHKSWN